VLGGLDRDGDSGLRVPDAGDVCKAAAAMVAGRFLLQRLVAGPDQREGNQALSRVGAVSHAECFGLERRVLAGRSRQQRRPGLEFGHALTAADGIAVGLIGACDQQINRAAQFACRRGAQAVVQASEVEAGVRPAGPVGVGDFDEALGQPGNELRRLGQFGVEVLIDDRQPAVHEPVGEHASHVGRDFVEHARNLLGALSRLGQVGVA